jgi:hypothetical protein
MKHTDFVSLARRALIELIMRLTLIASLGFQNIPTGIWDREMDALGTSSTVMLETSLPLGMKRGDVASR